jgi:hypothetical protein
MRGIRKGDFLWLAVIAAVVLLYTLPATAPALAGLTSRHAYLMGFAKFALLATMGELLVLRLAKGAWAKPSGLLARAAVWGVVGLLIVLMFTLFNAGVQGAGEKGLLPLGSGRLRALLVAFWTSVLMNLTFGPVFMAAHRVSDAWIEARFGDAARKGERLDFMAIVASVDWRRFLGFVVGRTIPLFWIPAHTLCFLLPGEYRVLAAALLSIALGVILSWGRRPKAA